MSEYTKKYLRTHPWAKTISYIRVRCKYEPSGKYKDRKILITPEELKSLWFRDKAYLMKQPSIDRINNNGDYAFENCRYIEHKINSLMGNKLQMKKVSQYTKSGEFLNSFNSLADAANSIGKSDKHISSVCLNKRKSAFGYNWKYI